MNDTVYVHELFCRLKTSPDPTLFDSLYIMYIYRYRQVFDNTLRFTVTEKVPFSVFTTPTYN
ncbi:hypothetical protein GCM10027347_47050 [Larkinella harenae]